MSVKKPEGEEIVEESIVAYRVQRRKDGKIQLRAGATVCVADTMYEALENYAKLEQRKTEEWTEHLREDRRRSISDGWISLKSFDTRGFTPEEILDHVVGQPLDVTLRDIDLDREVFREQLDDVDDGEGEADE